MRVTEKVVMDNLELFVQRLKIIGGTDRWEEQKVTKVGLDFSGSLVKPYVCFGGESGHSNFCVINRDGVMIYLPDEYLPKRELSRHILGMNSLAWALMNAGYISKIPEGNDAETQI